MPIMSLGVQLGQGHSWCPPLLSVITHIESAIDPELIITGTPQMVSLVLGHLQGVPSHIAARAATPAPNPNLSLSLATGTEPPPLS